MNAITVRRIQVVVARLYGLSHQTLLSHTRRHDVSHPRQMAMYLCCKLTACSLHDIGRRFGDFDHTTVMYARNVVSERIAACPQWSAAEQAALQALFGRDEPAAAAECAAV